jgi:hypothetical protein
MSISNLLVPNHYNLFVNSIFIEDSFSAVATVSQALNPAAATKIVFPHANISDINYSTVTSTYTIPTSGAYHFNANIEIQYQNTNNAIDTSITVSLLSGVTVLQAATSSLASVPDTNSTTLQLPILWYGFLNAGSLITVSADIPTISGGAFSLYQVSVPGTIFYGQRG